MSKPDILDFLEGIVPSDPDARVIGSGDTFNDSAAGVPTMGPPLVTITLPEEDGETVTHGRGKLVYYGEGGRKFFGFYSDMTITKEDNTITFVGTLKEE